VRLFLGCTEDPVDPGFEVSGSAFSKVFIGINPDMLTMPEYAVSHAYPDITRVKKIVRSQGSVPEPLSPRHDFSRGWFCKVSFQHAGRLG
jgi:hypothetical protein